jgi:hypothetical protein
MVNAITEPMYNTRLTVVYRARRSLLSVSAVCCLLSVSAACVCVVDSIACVRAQCVRRREERLRNASRRLI